MKLTIMNSTKYYPLNIRTRLLLEKLLIEGIEQLDEGTDSDKETLKVAIENMNQADIILTNVKPDHNTSDSGEYFKYKNKCSKIDLKRYGILNVEDNVSDHKELYNHNCLYLSFKNGGMSKKKLCKYKTIAVGAYIPIAKLKMICEQLDIYITLKKDQKTKHKETTTHYGDKKAEEYYDIGLIDEHYFIIEEVKYNSYAIKNYHTVNELKDWELLRGEGKREKRYIDSFDLIKILIENKDTHLQAITNDEIEITNTPYEALDGFSDEGIKFAITTNNNIPYGGKVEKKDNEEVKEALRLKINWNNAFLDFETRNDENNVIRPFMAVMEYEKSNQIITTFNDDMTSDKCVWDMLEVIQPDTKLIIQNAKFDFSFIIDKLVGVSIIENAGRIITASGTYKKKKIMVVDFINFTGMPLRDCAGSFKLDICKEYIPYRLYDDYDVLKNPNVNTEEIIKRYNIEGDDNKVFKDNISRWKLDFIEKGKYNALRYCLEYCKLDVKVLKQSYIKFRDMLKDELNISIDACKENDYKNILTISSLAKKYSQDKGYFDECVNNNGVLREFIQKSIVGGRTMISENKKKRIHNSNAVDANSLYPSAIHKLGGFLKGKPKLITKDTDLNKVDGYNVNIKIISHTINRKMPLFSVIEKGKRNFTNDMDGKTIYCGKIALEDLVKYHGIKYELIRGIYWDEGRTTVDINSLYQTRLRYKKVKDVKETIYKLILNSIYGFTIMKEHREGIKIKDNSDTMMKYISKNYNWIVSSEQIKTSDKWLIKVLTPTSQHTNYNHIGCEVLDMSKRIMNELVCKLEDVGYEVSYTDTDSCFMPDEAIEYMNNNLKQLLGNELGQFKLDFGNDISINNGFLLGKKSYYVEFNKADDKGKTEKYRMKGIPSSTIKFYSKQNGVTVKEIYEKLYNNETIKFDLCEIVDNIPTKFKVDNLTSRQLERKTMFERRVKF